MIRTIFFFGLGGFWTACFSNGLRHHRLLRKPQTHVLYTVIGLTIGYRFHKFEEGSVERYERMLKMKPYVTRMVSDIPDKTSVEPAVVHRAVVQFKLVSKFHNDSEILDPSKPTVFCMSTAGTPKITSSL